MKKSALVEIFLSYIVFALTLIALLLDQVPVGLIFIVFFGVVQFPVILIYHLTSWHSYNPMKKNALVEILLSCIVFTLTLIGLLDNFSWGELPFFAKLIAFFGMVQFPVILIYHLKSLYSYNPMKKNALVEILFSYIVFTLTLIGLLLEHKYSWGRVPFFVKLIAFFGMVQFPVILIYHLKSWHSYNPMKKNALVEILLSYIVFTLTLIGLLLVDNYRWGGVPFFAIFITFFGVVQFPAILIYHIKSWHSYNPMKKNALVEILLSYIVFTLTSIGLLLGQVPSDVYEYMGYNTSIWMNLFLGKFPDFAIFITFFGVVQFPVILNYHIRFRHNKPNIYSLQKWFENK